MNLSKLALAAALAAVSGAMAFAPTANAATTQSPGGTITFSGTVTTSTCSFGTSTASQTVTLASVGKSDLVANGVGQYPTVSKAFTINLVDCPAGSKVGAQFYSTNADTTTGNGTLKNTGTATDVDIQIADNSGAAITIASAKQTDDSDVSDQLTVPSSGVADLDYTAYYYVTGTGVLSGSVASTTQYVLNYQ